MSEGWRFATLWRGGGKVRNRFVGRSALGYVRVCMFMQACVP